MPRLTAEQWVISRANKIIETENIKPRKVVPQVVEGSKVDSQKVVDVAKPDDVDEVKKRAIAETEEPRAKVIVRQRVESDAPRKLAYEAMQTQNAAMLINIENFPLQKYVIIQPFPLTITIF